MEKKTILYVINENLEFNTFLKKYLINEFSLLLFNRETNIVDQLLSSRPACIIVNVDQLANDLVEELTVVQQWCELHFIPIIAIVNRFEGQDRTSYLSIADAVFYHPINSLDLIASVTKHIRKRNYFLSSTLIDSITGAFNLYSLKEELQRQVNDMKRSHEPLTLVYLKVETGQDRAIKEQELVKLFVSFIKNSIRPADFLGHYHDTTDFVLILPKTVNEDARKLMERLNNELTSKQLKDFFGNEAISFSAKIVEIVNATQSPEELLLLMPFSNSEQKGIIIDRTMKEVTLGFKKLKIAIIDDDRLIRELLKHQLEEIGEAEYDIEIKSFADGEEFFNDPWHRQNERFLLIIDRVMPKMDGLEILRKIRTEYDRKRYLCFMLTSKGSETDIALAIQKGANDYMTKPFSLKELKERIKRLLKGAR
ncbi:response regulator [Bacillaceae bacterium IKA-2]|nr:response regulator [Bacillaceae bacterium IKA-2]